jgi:exopolysaccharide biosynthesis predicted pyruvyltransferase EpsI
MSQTLQDVFTLYANKKFAFVKPGGNFGDELIYFGAEALANRLHLNFDTYTMEEFLSVEMLPDTVVYIHGSGGFNEWASGTPWDALKHASSLSKTVIHGPCSSSENSDYLEKRFSESLRECDADLFIFAREKKTHAIFLALPSLAKDNINILSDMDTAFHLTREAVEARVGPSKEKYTFFGFRKDNEKCAQEHEENYNNVIFDPATRCLSFDHWLRVHLHAKKIITNRTHSSVIGAVLGKDTTLFEGKYHKNRSIYEKTLKDMGITWASPDEAIAMAKPGLIDVILPGAAKRSWKIRNAFFTLCGVPLK